MATTASGVSLQASSIFGPPSEPIEIARFLEAIADARLDDAEATLGVHVGSCELQTDIGIELDRSIKDINHNQLEILKDPVLYAHVKDHHDKSVHDVYEAVQRKTRKKRKRGDMPELPDDVKADIAALQAELDKMRLKCWPLDSSAGMFVRGSRYTDYNTVHKIKRTAYGAAREPGDAIIIVSVYSRIAYTWNLVERCSQHALSSSQTLGDLYETIPCTSNELPKEVYDDRGLSKFSADPLAEPSGVVIVIDDVAYGDQTSDPDYAETLARTVSSDVKKGSNIDETRFDQLTIRLNEPYWLLHEGSCEHYLVFEEVRLPHPDDPTDGYPITLHITPPGLDHCRACQKVPAVYSIIGDVRLGESPCLLCGPCWTLMGPGDRDVSAHPLPKYEHGWLLDDPTQVNLESSRKRETNAVKKIPLLTHVGTTEARR